MVLRVHAATTESTLLRPDILGEIGAWRNGLYQFGSRIVGMPGIDAIDVREQDERVGLHHLCDEAGEFIVIGKHQLGNADGIILIDDGKNVVLEHYGHTGLLITVLFTRLEVLFHSEYLTNVYAELAEQVVVETNEFDLTNS